MAKITGPNIIAGGSPYVSQTVLGAGEALGDQIDGSVGKKFVRVLNAGTALVVGNVIQAPAISANFDDLVIVNAQAIGDRQVTVTLGGTAVTANQFQGGSVTFSTGEERTIVAHAAQSTTTGNVILQLDAPLAVALTTSNTATMRNLYGGVVQAPTTLTGVIVGVAIYAIPANAYGWLQTYGECGVLSDNTSGAVGSAIANSGATAGAAGVFVAGTGRAFLGHVTRALSSAKLITAKINI